MKGPFEIIVNKKQRLDPNSQSPGDSLTHTADCRKTLGARVRDVRVEAVS